MSSRGDKARKQNGKSSHAAEKAKEEKKLRERHKRLVARREEELVVQTKNKPDRNDLCSCGSGKKFKKCCMYKCKTEEQVNERRPWLLEKQ